MNVVRVGTLALVALLTSVPVRAATIEFVSAGLFTRAWDGVGSLAEGTRSGTFPLDAGDVRSDGNAFNETHYVFDGSGFLITVDHVRAGGGHSQSHATGGGLNGIVFDVTADTPYALSGNYSLQGTNRLVLEVKLLDITTGVATLFHNKQESTNVAGESFVVGEAGGTAGAATNFVIGTPTGTLLADHRYRLEYNFLVQAYTTTAGTNSASGNLHLQIGVVPLPGGFVLMLSALLLGLPSATRTARS
ncbi:MAG: hypothetical protein IT495_09605 [Gammaproteobacteria bacterium]|nr:hypothetical protein [Gammaproteobacteria bacterium]